MESSLTVAIITIAIAFGTLSLIYYRRWQESVRECDEIRRKHLRLIREVYTASAMAAFFSSLPAFNPSIANVPEVKEDAEGSQEAKNPPEQQFVDYTFM